MNKRFLLSLLGMLVTVVAWSITTPEDGKYYRIVNLNPEKSVNTEGVRHGYVITENTLTYRLRAEQPGSNTQYNQLWKYTNKKFQNAHTRHYIASNSSRSSQFQANKTGAAVTLTNKETFFILTCGMQIHADGSNNIVAWNDENNPSNHWDFEEVEVDEDEVAALNAQYDIEQAERARLEAIAARGEEVAALVQPYFSDFACTTLKSNYAAMDDATLTQDMSEKGIDTEVQAIVLRIKNNWADEINPAMSAKFRVMDYKCYTQANAKWQSKTTQMADMNNPTGIWTTPMQLTYVFVDSDIPEGTSLVLSTTQGSEICFPNNSFPLKKGMNIIYTGTDMGYNWIKYTVPVNFNKPIADYPAIKIHIEGGNVLGFADVAGLDETAANAEYKATLQNAIAVLNNAGVSLKKINFPIKGQYGIMWFPVDVYNQIWGTTPLRGGYTTNYNIYKSMKFYDNVLMWEWSTMGFMSRVYNGEAEGGYENLAAGSGDDWYPKYFNNLAPAMMLYAGKNPYSSDSYTCMPSLWAVESSYNAERVDFDVWCVGHESGHNNQGTINMPSSTEASNNYFSNVIQYLCGYRLSRGYDFMQNVKYMEQGLIFPHRDISMTLRMWYNLYLYYHRAQKNTAFSPTLFKLLRADGMSWNDDGSYNDGIHGSCSAGRATSCWIKFYKKACMAAQEDLTEYFRLWGFFIPCDHAFCGDYGNYYLTLTQKEIDDAIKWVKRQGWPENKQIMFVEDRMKPQLRHDFWATGSEYKVNSDGGMRTEEQLRADYGDMGDFHDYMVENPATPDYSYSLTGRNVTMSGTGGVGIIVYNEDGTIGYLSNRLSFTLPVSVAQQNFRIVIIDALGNETDARDVLVNGTPDEQKAALEEAINATKPYTDLKDNTGTKVGYYTAESLAELEAAIAAARQAIKNGDSSQYVALTRTLGSEMIDMEGVERISVQENCLYTIRNKARSTYLNNNNPGSDAGAASSKWAFVPVKDKPGYYYMRNYETRKLVDGWYGVEGTSTASAKPVLVKYGYDGAWYLEMTNEKEQLKPMHNQANGNCIVQWFENADGSAWYITKVSEIPVVTGEEVNDLIAETKDVMDRIGTITTSVQKLPIQCTDANAPYYVKTNRADSNFPLANLVDGNKNTSFFTKQGGTALHNITIDLGEGNEANYLRLTFMTAKEACQEYSTQKGRSPRSLIVQPSTSATSGYAAAEKNEFNDLPDGLTAQKSYYRDTREASKDHRYWRIQVPEVYAETSETRPYFGFAYMQVRTLVATVEFNEGYNDVDPKLMKKANAATKSATDALAAINSMLSNKATYDALRAAYDALYDAFLHSDAIDGITLDANHEATPLYDLQGRQIQKANQNGVYIQDGRKVIVK